jgi:hypothetical protein
MASGEGADLPFIGHKVRKRGTEFVGRLLDYNPASGWAYVGWDRGVGGFSYSPVSALCYRTELDRQPDE